MTGFFGNPYKTQFWLGYPSSSKNLKNIKPTNANDSPQNCMYIWVRDHRQHHKYSDTDADPHNANRGFFFSHIGWLMSKKHPYVKAKCKTIDMSDLEADPLVMFQKKYYKPLYAVFAILLPYAIPVYFWGESHITSFFVCYMWRNMLVLNVTWLVNSAAHLYGTRPYDKTLKPVESKFVAYLSIGEGWHNYHHAFPWDYRAAELGTKYSLTTKVIDYLASKGLIYDLKVAPQSIIEFRARRVGDGTHDTYSENKSQKKKDIEVTDEDNNDILESSMNLEQTIRTNRIISAQG